MRHILCPSGLLTALLVTHANATDLRTPAVYVSVELGRSSVSSTFIESKGGDLADGISIGYAFNPHFAVEVSHHHLRFFPLEGMFGSTHYYPDSHLGVNAVGAVQLSDKFRLLGRVGFGRTTMKSASNRLPDYKENDATLGVGLSFDFTPGWSVHLNGTRFMDTKVTTALLGVSYRF